MDLEKSGNLIEAALWFVVSAAFTVKAILANRKLRQTFWLLATSFVVFGVSDLIESETGAWWRPLWLLAVKAICVAGFVIGFVAYFRITRRPLT
ncbi:MAG TPA: hypothetical protein VL175_14090 [Pirellulales bacterium]|jgi:hypothetical protein|nr:hypothetical protein [Pirellulales bacterium]